MIELLLRLLLSLTPVLLLLVLLVFLDSFRLTSVSALTWSIVAGIFVAAASLAFNRGLLAAGLVESAALRRFVAPVLEELLKSAYLVYLVRSRRVGFLIDSAIQGFAIGAGFALAENLYYLYYLDNAGVGLFALRGFGTAIMHGSTMAIFGTISKALTDRNETTAAGWFVPGLVTAIAIHAAFNQVALHPILSTALLLATLPLAVIVVFNRSEKAMRRWLGTGLDTDLELLALIHSGTIADTRVGRYLSSLKDRFPGPVVADMLCLLEIHLELSVRAKGLLMARENGIRLPVGEGVLARLRELRFLEKSIGRAGKLALEPILNIGSADLWQIYVLEREIE